MTEQEFLNALKDINITLTNEQLEQLNTYYELLVEYNKVMNLTAITDKKDVYLKHFYDSLTLTKIIDLNSIDTLCDIGTGAGFPGLVLKIVFPNLKITLVDSLNKRINFLNTVIDKLNLENIEAIHERAEVFSINNIEKYDVITARAVAKLNILLELSIQAIKINGYFIAMKSNVEEELINIDKTLEKLNCKFVSKIEFKLPIENSNRTLIKVEKFDKTPSIYPRKFEQIKKKPL